MAHQELDASVIDPSREGEEFDVNLKEDLYKLKQQMAEMYQAWLKGHPPPFYPANPAFIPPLAQSQESPTVDSSPGFPIYHHYQGTTFQKPQTPPPKPVIYPPPPATPVFVAPHPLHSTDPPTKKPPKIPEHEEMFRKVRSLEQSFRNIKGLGGQVSMAYKDLCLFPDVQLLVGFKMPKFDLYNGHEDSVAHLRGFYSKMRGATRKEELLMAYFSLSLSGIALEWYTRQDHSRWYTWDDLAQAFTCHFQYNLEIVPDCLSLTKIEKKPSESFREYGFHWIEQAASVDPPMKESEMVDYFLQALEPTYFSHLVSAIGTLGNDTEKCWHLKNAIQELIDTNRIEVQTPEAPNINQNPLPTHQE
ncbi:uncharacterized protein [Nicotiana sylvestris]|uniref:uncharacterized protein n=1 Tax=Nicotiana sylvestris TaxID=4096 RepID=UPI00388CAC01